MPHTASLLRVARRLVRENAAAEDIVQETMLSAWRGFHQFQAGSNGRAWLFRILINAVNQRGRKLKAARAVESIELSERPGFAIAVEISDALDALSIEHREVLLLGVVEEFTCQEIADILSIPIGTVMSRLSRARQALREKLAPVSAAPISVGKEA